MQMFEIENELETFINKNSLENGSDTPDFVLAKFLANCLAAFNEAALRRDKWHGKGKEPSKMAMEIAARVWCDQDMRSVVMDIGAANEIAQAIDRVIRSQEIQPTIITKD